MSHPASALEPKATEDIFFRNLRSLHPDEELQRVANKVELQTRTERKTASKPGSVKFKHKRKSALLGKVSFKKR